MKKLSIPLTFTYQGKEYSGTLEQVMGAGDSAHFHLMIDNKYYGQLFYTPTGWRFYESFPELAEYFGSVVVSWVDSHTG